MQSEQVWFFELYQLRLFSHILCMLLLPLLILMLHRCRLLLTLHEMLAMSIAVSKVLLMLSYLCRTCPHNTLCESLPRYTDWSKLFLFW